MGKTSWGVLGLLFACLVHGAPTLTVATDVWPPFRIVQPDGTSADWTWTSCSSCSAAAASASR